jgi:hypothetical protein
MKFIRSPKCGKVRVNSKVRVGRPGSKRQRSYCARSAKIKGSWRSNPCSPNALQRKRWKC